MSRGRYRNDPDLIDRIVQLERRLSALERTPQAPNTGVNTGGITIKGGVLDVIRDDATNEGRISAGSNVVVNGEDGMSLVVYRSDTVPGADFTSGQPSLELTTVDGFVADPSFCFPTVRVMDKSGDTILSDSTNYRRGMDDPIMHQSFTTGVYQSSTSGTFAFIMSAEWYMYHAHCRIRVLVQNDGGNTSELRVTENGGTFTQTTSVPSGAFQYMDLIVKRSSMVSQGSNGNVAALNLEHRRTGGAGTIRTQVISVVGVDLSWFQPY